MNLWLDFLASNTTLLPHSCIYLDYEANDYTATTSIQNVVHLEARGMVAFIGSSDSSISQITAILAAGQTIPQCDGSSTSPTLSNKALFPTFFRTIASDALQGKAIFDFVYSKGWRRVSIISEGTDYGSGLVQVFESYATAAKVEILTQQTISLSLTYTANDWNGTLSTIKDANCYIILLFAADADVGGLLEAAIAHGMFSSKYVWIGSEAMKTDHIASVAPGMITSYPTSGYGPAYDQLNTLWTANVNSIPYRTSSISDYVYSYTACVDLFIRGMDSFMTRNPSYDVVSLANGTYTALLGTNPQILFNFPTTYNPAGLIPIDPVTGDPQSSFDFYNVQGGNWAWVSRWNSTTRVLTDEATIIYISGSSSVPFDNINIADYTFTVEPSSSLGMAFTALNIFLMVAVVFLGLDFWLNRTKRSIRSTSVPSQMIIFCGLMIPLFDVFTMTGTTTRNQCLADIWLVALPFTIVFAAILVKLYRIYRIFFGIDIGMKGIGNNAILIQTFGLISVTVGLLLIWTFMDPPVPTLTQINALYFQWSCSSSNTGNIIKYVIIGWTALLLFGCTLLAIQTREVRGDFNETQMVGITVYNQLVLAVIVLPLLITAQSLLSIPTLFLIKQVAILLLVTITLSLLFGILV